MQFVATVLFILIGAVIGVLFISLFEIRSGVHQNTTYINAIVDYMEAEIATQQPYRLQRKTIGDEHVGDDVKT